MSETRINDASLHYELNGAGTPIVFIHGGWLSGDMWESQIEHFSDEYQILTYDVRGHGQTGSSSRTTYSIDLFVDDLRALIETLSLDAPILCGLSLGSMIAQTYASRYPEDVRGLVLAGTMRAFPPLPITRLQQEVVFPRVPLYASMRLLGARSYFRLLLRGIRAAQGHHWIALKNENRSYAFDEVRRLDTNEFIKIFDAMYKFDSRGDLGITASTLVLTADHEAYPVIQQSNQLASIIENASKQTIADAGHLSNLDNPSEFNRELGRFLSNIE